MLQLYRITQDDKETNIKHNEVIKITIMRKKVIATLVFFTLIICSCSSKFNKSDLVNRKWHSIDGTVICLYANDSCKIEYASSTVYYGKWFFDNNKQRIRFEINRSLDNGGGFLFHLELMSRFDLTSTSIDELSLGKSIGDPDDINFEIYTQVE